MNKSLFLLTIMGLILSGCSLNEQSQIKSTLLKDITPIKLETAGTGSGGGGFIDEGAKEALNIAKNSLAQMIENADDSIFENLPTDKNKKWIISIIKNIEIVNESRSRYQRSLKFDYDLENQKMYVTKHFVETFDYGRLLTKPMDQQVSLLTELYLDILHELSHFYNIGVTEDTDKVSEAWAYEFMLGIGSEKYQCLTKHNDKDFVIALNPASGFGYYGYSISEPKYYEEDSSALLSIPMFSDDNKPFDTNLMMSQITRLSGLYDEDKEFMEKSSSFSFPLPDAHEVYDFQIIGMPKVLENNIVEFVSQETISYWEDESKENERTFLQKAVLDRNSKTLQFSITDQKTSEKTLEMNLDCIKHIRSIRINEFSGDISAEKAFEVVNDL